MLPSITLKSIALYLVVSLFLFFEMAIQVSPSVMSNQLMRDLNIDTFGLGVMSGFYFYSYTAMQIPSGLLLDKYNPRIIITISLLICAFGTFIFAIAENVYFGSIARILMGLGSAFAFVSVLVVTADLFESKYFAIVTGITQTIGAFGAMSGQLPIAALESYIGWRNTMLSLAFIGIILAFTVFKFLKYKKCGFTVNPLNNVPSNTKNNLMHVISKYQTWYVALYSCLLWTPMSGFASLWGVSFLVKYNGFSTNQAAFICSLMWLGMAIIGPFLGLISTSIKSRKKPLIITALIGAIAFGFVLLTPGLSFFWNGVLIFVCGAACSGQALAFTVVKENNKEGAKAIALGLNNMAVVISGALIQPLIGWALHSFNGNVHQQFQHALYIILFAYIGAVILALFFIKESIVYRK